MLLLIMLMSWYQIMNNRPSGTILDQRAGSIWHHQSLRGI